MDPGRAWSLLTVMEKKQRKIHALKQGQTIPFHAMFVIRVWDKSKDGLAAAGSTLELSDGLRLS